MNTGIRRTALTLAMGAALLGLQACGTSSVSKRISDGGVAGELIFPDPATQAQLREGSFPNLDNLRQIGPGLTKNQLQALIGPPHFQEGLGNVREWDYLFRFRSPAGVRTCQYKAIFDAQGLAQTFHWLPTGCADVLNPVPPVERVAERVAVPPPATPRRSVSLSTEALFAFDRSSFADLLPEGRKALDDLVIDLRATQGLERLELTGHADRLGRSAYNLRLSLARATTVRDYLARAGVPVNQVQVQGRGSVEPKVQCRQTGRAALIVCLAPNRRVEVDAQAAR